MIQLMSAKELREYLRLTEDEFSELLMSDYKDIPRIVLNNKSYFRKEAVLEYIEKKFSQDQDEVLELVISIPIFIGSLES